MRSLLPQALPAMDATELAQAYAVAPPNHRQLRVNFAASLDGAIEVGGVSKALSSPADRTVFHLLRGLADVILVGQSTAVTESYGPVGDTASGHKPPIAVSARNLRMDPASAFFTEPESRPFLLVQDSTDVTPYVDVAEIIRCGPTISYATGLQGLADVGLTRVLCEGGPRVFSDLLTGGLVDEVCLTIAPTLAGPGHANLIGGSPWPESPKPLGLKHLLEEDGFLFSRWSA